LKQIQSPISLLCLLLATTPALICLDHIKATKQQPQTLTLSYAKTSGRCSLSGSFMQELIDLFKADVLVESGTFHGMTAEQAAHHFKEVHTIELSLTLYEEAQKYLSRYPNVHVYWGDSTKVLPNLLKEIKGKIIFWLDGHYNFGGFPSAKGDNNSAIMGELQAIKQSGIKDAVILIDDVCYFQEMDNRPANSVIQGYPSLTQVENAILAIDKNYHFYIFGDIAIAYPASDNVIASPVIESCTISRLSDEKNTSLALVAQAESVIAQAQGAEIFGLKEWCNHCAPYITNNGIGGHSFLWYSLTLAHQGKIEEAQHYERMANSVGIYRHSDQSGL
jgi:hypothetical protein